MVKHKSGFVNIIGRPNVGKSTLLNTLIGERMSVVTHKPQTTRHRIMGIYNDENHQIVFSDTPGVIHDPNYEMQTAMNKAIQTAFEDADILLFMVDLNRPEDILSKDWVDKIVQLEASKFLVLNKTDLVPQEVVVELIQKWNTLLSFDETIPISALNGKNTAPLLDLIKKYLTEGPEYYPKDQLTDKSERFFVSEIIRSHILKLFKQEIPYSCEVTIESFKMPEDSEKQIRIEATVHVNRKSQKSILIGKNGAAIKRLGIAARYDIEKFLQHRVHLALHIKVKENWREDKNLLKRFGY